jgi:hypothetical protein
MRYAHKSTPNPAGNDPCTSASGDGVQKEGLDAPRPGATAGSSSGAGLTSQPAAPPEKRHSPYICQVRFGDDPTVPSVSVPLPHWSKFDGTDAKVDNPTTLSLEVPHTMHRERCHLRLQVTHQGLKQEAEAARAKTDSGQQRTPKERQKHNHKHHHHDHHHHHHHHRDGVVGYVMLGWKQLRWTPVYDNTTGLGPSALSNRYHGLAISSGGGSSRGGGEGETGNEQMSPEAYSCALVADVTSTSGEAEASHKGSGAFFLRVLPHLELHFR